MTYEKKMANLISAKSAELLELVTTQLKVGANVITFPSMYPI